MTILTQEIRKKSLMQVVVISATGWLKFRKKNLKFQFMIRIRLQKVGRSKVNLFRIVVAESIRARDGKVIEVLGNYNPYMEKPEDKVKLNWERFNYWKGVGAQVTENLELILKHATKSSKV